MKCTSLIAVVSQTKYSESFLNSKIADATTYLPGLSSFLKKKGEI